jgi:hypothetical protein
MLMIQREEDYMISASDEEEQKDTGSDPFWDRSLGIIKPIIPLKSSNL